MSTRYTLDLVVNVMGTERARTLLSSVANAMDRIGRVQEKVNVTFYHAGKYIGAWSQTADGAIKASRGLETKLARLDRRNVQVVASFQQGEKVVKVYKGSLEDFTKTLRYQAKTMNDVVVSVRGFQVNLTQLQSAFDRLNAIVTQASIMLFVINITVGRVRSAMLTAARAQEAYNEAVRKYGRHSTQAQRALRRWKKAQEDLNWAIMQAKLQAILFGLSVGRMVVDIATYIAKVYAAIAADTAHVAVLSAKVALMTMGVGVVIAAASAMAMYNWVMSEVNKSLKEYSSITEEVIEDTEGMYETWEHAVRRITGLTDQWLVGRAQNLVRQFVECSTNKEERMTKWLVDEYYKRYNAMVENYNKMIAEAERIGGKEGELQRKAAEEYWKTESEKLRKIYELWKLYWTAWTSGTEVSYGEVLAIVSEGLEPKLKTELLISSLSEIEHEYTSVKAYIESHPVFIDVDTSAIDEALEKLRELKEETGETKKEVKKRPPEVPEELKPPVVKYPPWKSPLGALWERLVKLFTEVPFPAIRLPGWQHGGLVPVTALYPLEAGEYVVPRYARAPLPTTLTVYIGEMRFEGRPLTEFDAEKHAEEIWRVVKDKMEKERRRRWRV